MKGGPEGGHRQEVGELSRGASPHVGDLESRKWAQD